MPGTFFGLEIARRGLNVHQYALEVTGHNLTNASTTGYTRQEAVFKTTDPYCNVTLNSSVTPGQLGTGVEVGSIRRIRDEYLDYQVRRSITDSAYWEDQVYVLQSAESCFADLSSSTGTTGINDALVNFFKAWMDLENSPQDTGIKASVAELGDTLAKMLGDTYNQLGSIQNNIAGVDITGASVAAGMLKDQVDTANYLLTQISTLNEAIKKAYSVGQQPNDLMDQRDNLLEQLSALGPVEVKYGTDASKQPTGDIQLKFFGYDLSAVSESPLSMSVDESNGHILLSIKDSGGDTYTKDLTNDCVTETGGSILGLEAARQLIIGFKSDLNEMASNLGAMIQAKDAIIDGSGVFFTGSLAGGNFGVAEDLLVNPSLLDGTKAGAVAAVRDEETPFAGAPDGCTVEEFYSRLLSVVGASVKETGDMADVQSAIKEQMETLSESVSGVNVDEELTKMIQFNYGFQAASRVISAMDEMLDVIINKLF